VTTRADPQGRPTIDLIADAETHLVPVGRLDFATSGLLLRPTTPRLADILTDPANAIPRVSHHRSRSMGQQKPAGKGGVVDAAEVLSAKEVVPRKVSGESRTW
jgi:23S rRNA pseudouridine2605 synthase